MRGKDEKMRNFGREFTPEEGKLEKEEEQGALLKSSATVPYPTPPGILRAYHFADRRSHQ